jgi:type IV secretory pathway protease TraF
LYWCQEREFHNHLRIGDFVQLVPSATQRQRVRTLAPHLPETETWMKQLVGQEGHSVCLAGDDVSVQGVVIAHRPLLARYPMLGIEGCWTLKSDEIFVLGTHAHSYDSRYGGPWTRAAVRGVCQAVWTWEGTR